MGHQRKSLDERSNVVPDIREYRCIISVLRSQSVYPLAEPLVVLRLGVDKAVEGVHDFALTHNHHSDGAYAGRLFVRRLEIYRCEISHFL